MTQPNSRRVPLVCLLMLVGLMESAAFAAGDYPNIAREFGDEKADWYRQCLRVRHMAPPAEDRLIGRAGSTTTECDALGLYYETLDDPRAGVDGWARVRACALATDDAGTLMMLYANGLGVNRNPSLALKYACSTFGAKNEMEARVLYFANQLRNAGGETSRIVFDICDDITSGQGEGECMLIKSRRAASRRQAKLDRLTEGWTEPQQKAFREAHAYLPEFVDVYTIDGQDYQGTAAAAYAIDAAEEELDLFVAEIEKLESGILPPNDEASSRQLERTLQALFQSLVQPENFNQSGRLGLSTVTRDGLLNTQAAWLRYRDKWDAVGQARYSSVESSSWVAAITARRIKQLEELLEWPYRTNEAGTNIARE
jgi:hypothetical protein